MFIGEAPGYHEDQQGRPFVGAAGRFLEELLASIGLKREQVFITNVVKCRPPANRDPLPSEISICSKYLEKQLEIIRPKIIVTLGRYSFARFFPKETISKARGRPRKREGVIFYPMFHPAAALHQQSLKRVIEEDIKAIPSLLKEAMESKEPAAPPPQQLSMF
jgi:DNA polymerase